jgi:hypothetical protein
MSTPKKAPSALAPKIAAARGLLQLGVAGTVGVASLAEAVHRAVLATAPLPALPGRVLTQVIAGVAYRGVRGVAGAVGKGGDALLGEAERLARGDAAVSGTPTVALPLGLRAAMNGVVGDRLAAMGNAVALPMSIETHAVAKIRRTPPNASGARVLFVHGLCMTDRHWQEGEGEGVCFGERLFVEHGHRPSYLRYNSGVAIAENGRRLAALLEARQGGRSRWQGPLHIVAHSLGGLVVRSALAEGRAQGHLWPDRLRHVVFLGTPHGGAPLERVGKTVDALLAVSRFSAPWAALGRLRSIAIRQLGHADVAPLAMKRGPVRFHAVAGTVSRRAGVPLLDFVGDGLVPLASALGERVPPEAMRLHTRKSFAGVGHLALIRHPEVAEHVASLLGPASAST